jgi:serine/threonine protein kinase
MPAAGFAGNARYEIVRRLGAGASGIVYEARDNERQARVALKTLTRLDASALYRFKREFRALADVVHKNLVRLHELVSDADDWFFTMELVDGVEILEWVWRQRLAREDPFTSPARSYERAKQSDRPPRPSSVPPGPITVDYDRVRSCVSQLVSALEALHAVGKLHRDIKPSNVLVAQDGRVIVVDFGIAKDLREKKGEVTEADSVVGTPLYMAPEQAAGQELTPAADLYAVGALLYMALTGRPPIDGDALDVLMEKQTRVPDPPRMVAPNTPEDLSSLCMDLLEIRPERRPAARDVIARLGNAREVVVSMTPPADGSASGKFLASRLPFVGRSDVIEQLKLAFERMQAGTGTIALVQGTSGMGKSAIVRQFLDGLGTERAVILEGRCYERETVPYKAFDSVIDALTQHLLRLRGSEQGALMPRDVAALARLFPVLDRVPAVADAPRRSTEGTDAQQVRKRAFVALRELLSRLGDRHPLVVFIDDLQWGDADSAALLRELTAPPDPPMMFLILSFRSEDVATNAALAETIDRQTGLPAGRATVSITLDALSPSEATRLAKELLGAGAAPGLADRIASESGGSPFFIGELVRFAKSNAKAEVRLETVLRERLRALDAGALRLLQVIGIAGRPIAQEVVFRAAALNGDERTEALAILRTASLVRSQGTRAEDRVECFHDRIRAAVVASIEGEALRSRHGELARALIESGGADPETMFLHCNAAGMVDRAREHAVAAAKKASLALAFDRATQFYRLALDLMVPTDERYGPLRVELADALANAGRGAEAADVYIASTAQASAADRLALQRRAAEELLFSGHIDRGMDVIAEVLAHFGKRFARERWQAILTLLLLRLWLTVRGRKFKQRDASTIAATELILLDVYLSASIGLSVVDTMIAAPFSTRNVIACLAVGEPWHVCRSTCQELLIVASEGRPVKKKVDAYLSNVRALAEQVNRPDLNALILATTGLARHFCGEWAQAYEGMTTSLGMYLDTASGATAGIRGLVGQNFTIRWEIDTFRYFSMAALVQLGRLNEVEEKLTAYLRDARERGDLYILTNLQIGDTNIWWLARGTPDESEAVVTEAMHRWSKRGFQMQHWWEMHALGQANLYRGKNADAYVRIKDRWGALRRSLLLRVQYLRLRAIHLRGRAALALACDGRDRKELLAAAEADAKRIAREDVPWANPMAELLQAGVERQRGDLDKVKGALERSVRGFESADMALWATAARWRLAEVTGGEGGKATAEKCIADMRAKAVKEPEKMLRTLAPGFVERS